MARASIYHVVAKNGFVAMRDGFVFAADTSEPKKLHQVMKSSPISRRKRGFTLIELLVVIAIIAILAAAGFAVGTSALNRARKVSAQATATSINQAVDAFFSEYGMFPVAGGAGREIDTGDNTVFLNALIGQDRDLNPRGVRFLSVKEGTRQGDGGRDGLVFGEGGTARGLFDPWGNAYTVILDTDYEERLTFTTPDNRSVTLNGRRVAVFSPGVPPGDNATTSDLVKSW